jgi:PAS domain S-box-containing protein
VFTVLKNDFSIPVLSGSEIYSLVIDKSGNLYFGSGMSKYHINLNSNTTEKLFKYNGFVSDGCTSMFLDMEDNLWISDTRGLQKLISLAFRNHNSSIGFQEDEVTAVNELSDGRYIFGHNNGITIAEDYNFRYIPLNKFENFRQGESRILDLQKDKSGNIWISAYKMGAGRMDKSGNIRWYTTPDSSGVNSVIQDDNGNIFAASTKGFYILKNDAFEKYSPHNLSNFLPRKIFNIHDGNLWASASNGVGIIHNNNFKYIYSPDNRNASNVFAILKDNKNRILLGTIDGLYILLNDTLVKFKSDGFSVDDPIYAISQDEQNNIWIGTNKQLIFWDGSNTVRYYDSKNGRIPGEINRAALFFDSSGKLWIGTDLGVSRYIKEFDVIKNVIPKVIIKGFVNSSGKIEPLNSAISIPFKDNTLKFVFRAVSYVNENSLEYKVKLEGYDNDWVNYKQSDLDDIIYRDLTPGNYVLKVKAKNFSGSWSSEFSSAAITITNPYYYRWWFILLVLIIFIALSIAFYFYRKKGHSLSRLEKEVTKRTEELTKAKEELVRANESLEERVNFRTKELSESEEKFRSVFDQASDGIVIYDIETKKLLHTNNTYKKMLGYEGDEMFSLTVYDIAAHEPENINAYINKIKKGDYVFLGERNHKTKNGTLIPVEASSTLIDYTGKQAICVVVRDITERKKAKDELKKSEERYKSLIETADDIILLRNFNFEIILANNKFYESLGIEKDNPSEFYNRLHPEETGEMFNSQQELLRNGKSETEFRLRIKDGNWVHMSGKSIIINDSDNNPSYILSIYRDITGRINIERALFESEKRFRELVGILPETIFETDNAGTLTFVNDTALSIFGFTREDLIKGFSIFSILAPEEHERVAERFGRIISGENLSGTEYKGLKKDGTLVTLYVNTVPLIENDERVGVLGIAVDISAQKIIEEKLIKLSGEQKELIAVKDKFFSIIAHDLRNPFTGLLGFTDILKTDIENLNKDEIVKISEHINKSATNVFNLLNNLLQWGKIQTGKIEIKLQPVNVTERINTAIELLKNNSAKKEITVENEVPDGLLVTADSNMIDSILQNLLANSIKFTNKKGKIKFTAGTPGTMVSISVTDNGVGIPKDKLETIFKTDHRTSTLGTEREPGTGLGITLCKEMTELQHGTFEITSTEGKGTTVSLSLPAGK